MSLLRKLGIYGYEPIEDFILAGLLYDLPVLLVGHAGTAKTQMVERLAIALEQARAARGLSPVNYQYRDVSTAQVEDVIGYPLPPDLETLTRSHAEGNPARMQFVYSPNTIAFSLMMGIDEINRCDPSLQNRWHATVNERRVDGVDLPLRWIFGMMNPPNEYEGTELLGRAFADRFNFLIHAPSYKDLSRQDQERIARSGLAKGEAGIRKNQSVDVGSAIDLSASEEIYLVLEEGRRAFQDIIADIEPEIGRYVAGVIQDLNASSNKKARTQALLEGRRASMIAQNIVALHAVRYVQGKGNLQQDSLDALLVSFVHEACGDHPLDPNQLAVAHDMHKKHLLSKTEQALEIIRAEPNVARRVRLAFDKKVPKKDLSGFVQDAHTHFKRHDLPKSYAFSLVLLERLLATGRVDDVARYVVDELVADVHHVLKQDATFKGLRMKPGNLSSAALLDLLSSVDFMRKSGFGRYALLIAPLVHDAATRSQRKEHKNKDVGDVFDLQADARGSKGYTKLDLALGAAGQLVQEFSDLFHDLPPAKKTPKKGSGNADVAAGGNGKTEHVPADSPLEAALPAALPVN